MARQKGLFKITGTIGDINFYITHGIGYARKAGGGFNSHAIRTLPSMQRVRENASEFGNSSRVKKQFRLSLLPFIHEKQNRNFHSGMTQLFLKLKALDFVSERGKRCVQQGIQTAKGKQLLRQYDLTPKNELLEALYKTVSFDWPSQTLRIRNFNLSGLKAPQSATHLGVTLGVLDFDFKNLESSLVVSPTRFINLDTEPLSFQLTSDVIRTPIHTGIVLIGVRYYEVISDEVYGLETLRGVRVLEVV